jgi:hypothetical protein
MQNADHFFGTGIGLAVLIFLVILAILWFILPFLIWSIQISGKETAARNKLILAELKLLNKGITFLCSNLSLESETGQPPTQKCPDCGFENSIEMTECAKCGHRLQMP